MTGRELDALVAEKVFGTTGPWMHDIDGTPDDPYYDVCRNCGLQDRGETSLRDDNDAALVACPNAPPYSTDIAAAWQVVEKMRTQTNRADWFTLKVVTRIGGDEFACNLGGGYYFAKDAPMAICRAALKAAGVEVPA